MESITWKIEGMRCGGCAHTVQARLISEPGVRQAVVTYPPGVARMLVDPAIAKLEPVIGLLEQAGYRIEAQEGA